MYTSREYEFTPTQPKAAQNLWDPNILVWDFEDKSSRN